jgi:ADP-ribosylglycohydrolase
MGYSKEEIFSKIDVGTIEYKPFEKFNKTCYETLNNCLYAFFNSVNFEDAICKVISYGGDTDTNAAIVGGMAEAFYGIPEHLVRKARKKLPTIFSIILDDAYAKKSKNI